MIYNNLSKRAKVKKTPPSFNFHFMKGAFLEVKSQDETEFEVNFFNHKTNELVYTTILKGGMWSAPSIKYFIKWRIEIFEKHTRKKVFEHIYNCKDKRVYIALGSKSLGDTLAWIPYIDEFRKLHGCKVICSTFHNDWLSPEYPEIEFVKPGRVVPNLYALYEIGWYYNEEGDIDSNMNPKDFKQYPLQQTPCHILSLPYKEIKPKIYVKREDAKYKKPYVIIAPHGSKHASYWHYPKGWQRVINFLNKHGYKAMMVTKEPLGDDWNDSKLGGTLTNVIDKTGDFPLQQRFTDIKNAKAFVGIGSGLSWVSWALNTPTILISGFSDPNSEMQDCYRIPAPPDVCSGCYNTQKLDAGDWEWCPFHKNTPRQFECGKNIHPEEVINNLKKILNIY